MSENGEKCWSVFPKAQDDVFKCLVLSTTQNTFSLLSQRSKETNKIFTFKTLESEKVDSFFHTFIKTVGD